MRGRGRARIRAAILGATLITAAGVGVAGTATTATADASSAASTQSVLARWRYYDTFSLWTRCMDKGAELVRSGYASRYDCRSDHPFWQLWVLR